MHEDIFTFLVDETILSLKQYLKSCCRFIPSYKIPITTETDGY